MIFRNNANKNVDSLLRLRHSRYRQTPNNLKRVNAHANGVNNLLQFLMILSNSPIIQGKNQKWTFQSFVFILSLLCHHKLFIFRVQLSFNCNTTAKIRKILQISHSKSKKFQKKLQVSKKVLIFAARKERISSR